MSPPPGGGGYRWCICLGFWYTFETRLYSVKAVLFVIHRERFWWWFGLIREEALRRRWVMVLVSSMLHTIVSPDHSIPDHPSLFIDDRMDTLNWLNRPRIECLFFILYCITISSPHTHVLSIVFTTNNNHREYVPRLLKSPQGQSLRSITPV